MCPTKPCMSTATSFPPMLGRICRRLCASFSVCFNSGKTAVSLQNREAAFSHVKRLMLYCLRPTSVSLIAKGDDSACWPALSFPIFVSVNGEESFGHERRGHFFIMSPVGEAERSRASIPACGETARESSAGDVRLFRLRFRRQIDAKQDESAACKLRDG